MWLVEAIRDTTDASVTNVKFVLVTRRTVQHSRTGLRSEIQKDRTKINCPYGHVENTENIIFPAKKNSSVRDHKD